MSRRNLFSALERESLLFFPEKQDALIQYYTLNESDLAVINQHRGQHNRLGFAVQLSGSVASVDSGEYWF